jgi:outer membrane protein OmpA-like peptidoglycan-associated protein
MRGPFRLPTLGLLFAALFALASCASAPVRTGLTPQQVAALRQEGFQQTDDGWAFGAEDKILFASNTARIRPEMSLVLERIGQALRAVVIEHLRVDGYTDKYGSDAYNDALSLRRAQAVADVLTEGGFPAGAITVRGLGRRYPVVTGNTGSDEEQNRRVAIVVSSE